MTITLNGDRREVADGATVAAVVALLAISPESRGVAVAVDAEVVPRTQWITRPVAPGARVEVVTAMQGG